MKVRLHGTQAYGFPPTNKGRPGRLVLGPFWGGGSVSVTNGRVPSEFDVFRMERPVLDNLGGRGRAWASGQAVEKFWEGGAGQQRFARGIGVQTSEHGPPEERTCLLWS